MLKDSSWVQLNLPKTWLDETMKNISSKLRSWNTVRGTSKLVCIRDLNESDLKALISKPIPIICSITWRILWVIWSTMAETLRTALCHLPSCKMWELRCTIAVYRIFYTIINLRKSLKAFSTQQSFCLQFLQSLVMQIILCVLFLRPIFITILTLQKWTNNGYFKYFRKVFLVLPPSYVKPLILNSHTI